jgi:hypothetical protein
MALVRRPDCQCLLGAAAAKCPRCGRAISIFPRATQDEPAPSGFKTAVVSSGVLFIGGFRSPRLLGAQSTASCSHKRGLLQGCL